MMCMQARKHARILVRMLTLVSPICKHKRTQICICTDVGTHMIQGM